MRKNPAVGLNVPSSYFQCIAPEFHHFSIQTWVCCCESSAIYRHDQGVWRYRISKGKVPVFWPNFFIFLIFLCIREVARFVLNLWFWSQKDFFFFFIKFWIWVSISEIWHSLLTHTCFFHCIWFFNCSITCIELWASVL